MSDEEIEFKDINIEGVGAAAGDFAEVTTRDIIIDIPLDLFKYYGMWYGSNYGYRF